jgi:hypothetical protein
LRGKNLFRKVESKAAVPLTVNGVPQDDANADSDLTK